jgi:hypothetical protein
MQRQRTARAAQHDGRDRRRHCNQRCRRAESARGDAPPAPNVLPRIGRHAREEALSAIRLDPPMQRIGRFDIARADELD